MDVTRFFGNATYQGYGQTEVLPIAMMRRECGSPRMRPGLQPLPFAELQIRDEDNNAVRPGEADEIVGKCEGQMRGFWNNSRFDADGYLYVLDRADDMVISGGFNIYLARSR